MQIEKDLSSLQEQDIALSKSNKQSFELLTYGDKELEEQIKLMIEYSNKTKEIANTICSKLGDKCNSKLFNLLNKIQSNEITNVTIALSCLYDSLI